MSRFDFRLISVAVSVGLLAGCSTMPEWTKPSTWVDGVTDAGKPAEKADDKAETTQVAKPATATGTDAQPAAEPLAADSQAARIKPTDAPTEFPNVNTQAEPRQVTTTESQRREIRDSLVADRDNAQHTADELKGGQSPAAPPPPAAKPASTTPATGETDEKKPDGTP